MNARVSLPSVSVGLPVYNGEDYLEEALDGLLAQTYSDFELIISDNASTDRTPEICQAYATRDKRIRYVRQPTNLGAVPNHNVLLTLARGRYFKWVGADDIYLPRLLERCVEAIEAHPEAVLVNVWDGVVDEFGNRTPVPYPLDTASPSPRARFRSVLRANGGNDFYGLFRTADLRRIRPLGSFLHSDRAYMAELAMNGPFHQVPEVLFYRREHPARTSHAGLAREVVAKLDRSREQRGPRNSLLLYGEYVRGLFSAILHARIPWTERGRCAWELLAFLIDRFRPAILRRVVSGAAPTAAAATAADPT
ncbi:MAG TPA: glycosyltransferase family 2 protein [Nocardioides sp.]|nr:glycosyltransferase family 2 protein [Nocardioides sp.]